jgi:hypothetical protein
MAVPEVAKHGRRHYTNKMRDVGGVPRKLNGGKDVNGQSNRNWPNESKCGQIDSSEAPEFSRSTSVGSLEHKSFSEGVTRRHAKEEGDYNRCFETHKKIEEITARQIDYRRHTTGSEEAKELFRHQGFTRDN